MKEDIIEKIKPLVLKNALNHKGRANEKAVLGMFLGENKEYRTKVAEIKGIIDRVVEEINKLSYEEQQVLYRELTGEELKEKVIEKKKELPPLPNTDKYEKVVMRLAPFPSGPLHIGNARMVILNDYYIKRYNGKLLLVFDDTIGSTVKSIVPEAYDLIPEDLQYLGVKWHEKLYKSDRIGITYEYCKKLIEMDKAYVCTCDAQKWREEHRKKGIACIHRNNDISTNLEEWDKMLEGVYNEGEAVVRLKTDIAHPNPALRDNVIMRISNKIHPRVGDKYKIWPLLEFSWAVDDHLLGITHILRGKDLIHEDKLESIIWDFFNWPKVEFIHYGLISFRGLKLSKTEARLNIEKGVYDGWSDPRIWSIQSLKRRGILAESIRELILDLGLSLADIKLSTKSLYAINRSKIDPIANRYFFVPDPRILTVENVEEKDYEIQIYLHPDDPEKGTRTIKVETHNNKLELYIWGEDASKLKKDEVLRLKDFINIKIIDVEKLRATLIPGGIDEFREHANKLNTKLKIIQWVPKNENIQIEVIGEHGEKIEGLAEINCTSFKVDQIIQFERFGFCRVDQVEPKIKLYFAHK